MGGGYGKRIESLKRLQLALIFICVAGIFAYILFITKPEITAYAIKDECGPIGGSISHSIDDEDTCGNACSAYCLSMGEKFHKSAFEIKGLECNKCDCLCKKNPG